MIDVPHMLDKSNLENIMALFDVIHDSVIVLNEKMTVTHVNAATCELFGYEKKELVGKHLSILLPQRFRASHDSLVKKYFRNPHARGMQPKSRLIALTKAGAEASVSISLNPVDTQWGKSVVAIIRDMRDWEMLERNLAESKKSQTIAEMSAGLAHNFNNIISAIIGNVYLARRATSPRKINHYLEKIDTSSDHASAIVRELMGCARAIHKEHHKFSLNHLIKKVARTVDPMLFDCVDTAVDMPDDEIIYYGDQSQLHQAILNLLNNAAHAVADSRKKSVSISLCHKKRETCKFFHGCNSCKNGGVQIAVADTGIGIPKKITVTVY